MGARQFEGNVFYLRAQRGCSDVQDGMWMNGKLVEMPFSVTVRYEVRSAMVLWQMLDEWCEENFGPEYILWKSSTERRALIYNFVKKEDALLFKMMHG